MLKTIFLKGDLEKEIYMNQSNRFVIHGKKIRAVN